MAFFLFIVSLRTTGFRATGQHSSNERFSLQAGNSGVHPEIGKLGRDQGARKI